VDVDRESIEVTSNVDRMSIVKALEVQVLKVEKQMSTMNVSKVIIVGMDLSSVYLCRWKHNPFKAMVIVAKTSCQGEDIFHNCPKTFMIWEILLLCVTFFSTFVWIMFIFCCMVCEFVQTLAERQLV